MVFSDLYFLYFFLPLCLCFYFITKKPAVRNLVLIAFSLYFYSWGEPIWVVLLIISSVIDYINGLIIDKFRGKPQAKAALIWSLTANLGILFFFKYRGFFIENLNALCGLSLAVPKFEIPIGISFYTFQTISYTIDCYWGKVKTQRNFFRFLMYVSLFPQLVAGPIVRYQTIAKEIDSRSSSLEDISYGFSRIITGLAKKVIIADNLSPIILSLFGDKKTDYANLFSDGSASVGGMWLGAMLVGLEYYFDFSGYSDMAIGLGRIFGFHFNENFNYPFICQNIQEFWQRWHISLGEFFRDYLLYIPVFGKRRKYFSLFLVWFCTGLWHGASWNFIIWGLYYGVFIFIEQLIGRKRMKKIPAAVLQIYTKFVIIFGFGIFYFENSKALGYFIKSAFGGTGLKLLSISAKNIFFNNIWLILAALLFCFPIIPAVRKAMLSRKDTAFIYRTSAIVCNFALLILSSVLLIAKENHPFLYFNF